MGHQKTIEDCSREILAKVAEAAQRRFANQIALKVQNCESPIEELFVAGLLHCAQSLSFNPTNIDWRPLEGKFPDSDGIHVYPQCKIGAYRVDFFAIAIQEGAVIARAIAECDGHDFHERTKQQAAHDKQRDRYFAKNDITVMRYTGSEIWRDACDCAYEFLGVLENALGGRPWDAEEWHG